MDPQPRSSAVRVLLLAGSFLLSGLVLLTREAPAAAERTIPSPESVLGFVPGEDRRLPEWAEVLEYLKALAAASDRVRVEEIGQSTLGRPFVLATVSSAANLARLEEIRRDNARLADPRGLADADADALVARGKVVVAMGFSIHSTEVGGTLAALRLLHRLAAQDDPQTRRVLDSVVLLVVPSQNPDGADLVSAWYRKQLGTAFEGTAPPVLYHAFAGHDLNRDWCAFTQQETRLVVRHVYQRWHPQIVHDVHQMDAAGARLFLPPYTDPWEPNVDGALVAAANALGAAVASRLTSDGRTGILTGTIFDAWAPERAYPHTHGGVRILSEAASVRIATPLVLRRDELRGDGFDPRAPSARFPLPWPGGSWRLADVVDTQLAVCLGVLDEAARGREEWLRRALGVNRRAAARSAPFAFVVPAEQREPAAAGRLLAVLQTGEVEVLRARTSFVADGREYPTGTHVVLMQQPASAFAKTILERQRYPDLRECTNGPPKRPYDVTAHTLPLLLGVETEAIAAPFAAELEPLAATGPEPPGAAVPLPTPPSAPGRVEGRGPRFALGHTTADFAAVARLLAAGVEVRWALAPFEAAGRRFPAGALLVPGAARLRLEPLARELGIVARAVQAEPKALRLVPPRVGLYASWVPAVDEGWTRFVLEKEAVLPYQTLRDREIRSGRLAERFDAIVLPDQPPQVIAEGHAPGAMPTEYTGGLGQVGAAALRAFVEMGGTLVAFDSAALYAITALRLPVRDALAGLESQSFFCPGSILEVLINHESPLGHGLPDELPIWFEGSPAFEGEGVKVARYEAANPLLSGWLIGSSRLSGRGALVELPLGRGKVILFGFRPQYRAQARVTYPALLNALYLAAARP